MAAQVAHQLDGGPKVVRIVEALPCDTKGKLLHRQLGSTSAD